MKKRINNKKIFLIFVGVAILILTIGGVGVVAVTLSAEQITYTPVDTNFNVDNTKDAIDELYKLSRVGDATSNDLLFGKEAFSGGNKILGSMPNRETFNWKPQGSEQYNLLPGYYSGGVLDSSAAYSQGFVDGQKSALDNLEVEYTYHKHTGSAGSTPNGCYTNLKTTVCQQRCSYQWLPIDADNDAYYIVCPVHGRVSAAMSPSEKEKSEKNNGKNPVCGRTTSSYSLGCGKTEETIESVTIKY